MVEINDQTKEFIKNSINDMCIAKPIDWESNNFDKILDACIKRACDSYVMLQNNTELSEKAKETSILLTNSYLLLENVYLWLAHKELDEVKALIKKENIRLTRKPPEDLED